MTTQIPFIKLIGDEEENFYQLGLKDRENCLPILNQIRGLVKTPWGNLNQIISSFGQSVLTNDSVVDPIFKRNIMSYSEGLNLPWEEVAWALLLPELMSSLDKWTFSLNGLSLGCSSYFMWDDDMNAPVHGRILDFSLLGSFDQAERAILYRLKNSPQIFCFSSAGLPYPSLTAMTDQGVTLAIHQKFTNLFSNKGIPVFDLSYRLLNNCSNINEAINFLKKHKSMTTWCFYMSFKNGDVLRADISPEGLFYNKSKIEPGKVLYFNNMLENKELEHNFYPFGIPSFCQMRKKQAHKQILQLQKEKVRNEVKLLKHISKPYNDKRTSPQNWSLSPLTFNSLAVNTFNAVDGTALFTPGPAPKILKNKAIGFKKIWDMPKQQEVTIPGRKIDKNFDLAYRALAKTQTMLDRDDIVNAYHYIQMAINHFKGWPEETIANFFFNVLQYIHEPEKELRFGLLERFKKLSTQLPSYLGDHCKLFIFRLEKILDISNSVNSNSITNPHLKKILESEEKIPRIFLHKSTTLSINVRIDILDILYLHSKL